MKLDRNINPDGRGKYALIQMRSLTEVETEAIRAVAGNGNVILNLNIPGSSIRTGGEAKDQFFVLKYKDRFAAPALLAYAIACRSYSHILKARGEDKQASEMLEFADEVQRESDKAKAVGDALPT